MSNLEKKVNALCAMVLCEGETERAAAANTLRKLMAETKREPVVPVVTIREALAEIGVPDSVRGHRYLEYAIELVLEDRKNADCMIKFLYPEVAKHFDTKPGSAERCIRHAIESAWGRCNYEAQYKYFGNIVSASKGIPTNREFITRVANALRRDG